MATPTSLTLSLKWHWREHLLMFVGFLVTVMTLDTVALPNVGIVSLLDWLASYSVPNHGGFEKIPLTPGETPARFCLDMLWW